MTQPENWWGTGLKPKVLFEIARDDGIPVMWVPPSTVLLDLAASPDHTTRMAVLLLRKQEILEKCKAIISHYDDSGVVDAYVLTGAAIAAYEDGHHEAAMALAVSVSEPLAILASTPWAQCFKSEAAQEKWEKYRKKKSKYTWAKLELSDAKATLSYPHNWQYKILIAPIPLFFTNWFPDNGDEPPKSLSRHVVAHQPTQQHFSPENALLSLMLATSLLYATQEWSEDVRFMDGEWRNPPID